MKSPRDSGNRLKLTLTGVVALLVWLTLPLSHSGAQSAEKPARRKGVLALYWQGKDFPANVVLDKSIQAVLRSTPAGSIEYYAEYLEDTRFPGESQSLLLRDFLRQKYAGRGIDVVIALSSAPLDFLLKYRNDLFPNTPIVFHTSNRAQLDEQAEAGLTGVVVDSAYRNTLDLALKLHPAIERAMIITGTPGRDKKLEAEVRQELKEFEGRVAFTYLTDLPLHDLIAQVKDAPARSIIFYIRYSQDDLGRTLDPYNVLTLITESAKVPVYTAAGSLLGRGSVGGYSANLEDCGNRAAEIALRIVNGARPQDIPVVMVPTVPMLDWRQLHRWGISKDRLPRDSVIRYKEPTFWERYKWRIIGSVSLSIVETALIIGLLAQMARRKRAEQALRESEEQARRTLVEQMLVGVAECDAAGKFVLVNQRFCDITGYTEAELLEMRRQDITHPDDLLRITELYHRLVEDR